MTRTVMKQLRGNTSEVAAYVGHVGQLLVDSQANRLHLLDGSTPGGHRLARHDELSFNLEESFRADFLPERTDPVHMPAIRRRLRIHMADVFDYGIILGNTGQAAANVTKWDAMMTDLRTNHPGVGLFLPGEGTLYAATQLTVPFGLEWRGEHASKSVVIALHGGDAVRWNGQHGAGGVMSDMSIGYDGSNGNIALHVGGTGSVQPHFFRAERLNITHYSHGTINYNVLLDGSGSVGALVGVRECTLKELILFSTVGWNVETRNARSLKVEGISCFQGDGTASRMNFSGAPGFPSSDVRISDCLATHLNFGYVANWSLIGGCHQTASINAGQATGGFYCGPGVVANADPAQNRVI